MEGKNLDQIIEKHRKEKPADWSGFDMKPMSELDAGDGASIDDYPMGDGREQRIEKKNNSPKRHPRPGCRATGTLLLESAIGRDL